MEKTKCKICQKELATFRLVSHIKFSHKDWTAEKYVQQFGEFRINENKKQIKLKKKINSINKITCKLCGETENVGSFRGHLRWKHPGYNSDIYATKFGEFRPKIIKQDKIKETSNFKCEICEEKLMHNRQLMFHLSKHPEISQKEYVVKHILNGKVTVCKCGCGMETEFLKEGKDGIYFRDYIKGHWDWVKPGYHFHTPETKKKMRLSAIKRLEKEKGLFKGVSKLEKELQQFVKDNYTQNIIFNDNVVLSGHELDIYLPDLKLAIEFNGTYYHSDLFKARPYHLNKTKECNLQDIKLIHIWDSEWIHKKSIIMSMVLNKLGKTPNKIYARKCEIKGVDKKTSCNFLASNHLQGNCISKTNLGLYYDNELVSIMTFGKLRKSLGQNHVENNYELLRFCNKLNTNVIGGASRLFKGFIKNHDPEKIISYASRDWGEGNLYKTLGMTQISYTELGYDWFKSKIRYNRFNFRKDVLVKEGADPNKTEYEIMLERGYYRVWNTGNIKFEWK